MPTAPYFLGILCVLSSIHLNIGLTGREMAFFESHEIPVVPGSDVHGRIKIRVKDDKEIILDTNGMPDHAVGQFPNKHNEFKISEQNFIMRIPRYPVVNPKPTCLPANSIIGFATNGVAILSPFDSNLIDLNNNAGSSCQGRTAYAPNGGFYYYAQVPYKCSSFIDGYLGHNSSQIYGVALDGFPIYGPSSGKNEVTNADLDACHGKFVDGEYRYYMTAKWPYVLGCFRGEPGTVEGAPAKSEECKFACNTDSVSNDVRCKNDFKRFNTKNEL